MFAGEVTVKLLALVAVPDEVVTVIGPVVAPAGTVATISVVELTVNEAEVPLKLTAVGLIKFVPVIVMLLPTLPLPGLKLLIMGVELLAPLIEKLCEMLKKMFPFAATLIRPCAVGVPGIVTVCEPSLAVSFAKIIGKEFPPSIESRICTLAQLTGARFVFATFQVTV